MQYYSPWQAVFVQVTCLQFTGNRIVSGSDDNTLRVWNATTGKVYKEVVKTHTYVALHRSKKNALNKKMKNRGGVKEKIGMVLITQDT